MLLLKKRQSQYLIIVAALIVGCYFCTMSVEWMMAFFILAPMLVGYVLRTFVEDHDYADDFQDADWRND